MNERLTPWQEHDFWLSILKDHAHFLRDFLSSTEKHWVKLAKQYISYFRKLKQQLRQIDPHTPIDSPEMIRFACQVYPVAYGYCQLEGHMQHLRMRNQVILNLTPTYFNGTISENQEYLRMLCYYVKGKQPPLLPLIDLLTLWLDDQLGHAYLLLHNLDLVETETRLMTTEYTQKFSSYITRNEQWKGFLRFTEPLFPAQIKFIKEIVQTVIGFNELVHVVVREYENDQILTTATLRFLEHHFPETCYFLKQLGQHLPKKDRVMIPDCQLTPPYAMGKIHDPRQFNHF